MLTPDTIPVEVVYAGPEGQLLLKVLVAAGTTAAQAVACSGIESMIPGFRWDRTRLGVFSRRIDPDHVLSGGDRVEIYRALTLDPMEARRRRAHRGA